MELSPGLVACPVHFTTILLFHFLSSTRELNGNNITRIHKNDFVGLKQLRVL